MVWSILNIGDSEDYDKIIEKLTEILIDADIIANYESAKSIFKKGKLEEIIGRQVTIANSNQEEVRKLFINQSGSSVKPINTDDVVEFVEGIDKEDIDFERAGKKYSTQDLLRINIEIRASLALVSDGDKINVRDKKVRKEVIETLTERLRDADLISETQTAEDIFVAGKLDEALRKESTRTNAKATALDKFLDTALSDDEADIIRETFSGFTEEELSYRESADVAEELYDKMIALLPISEAEKETRREMIAEEFDTRKTDIEEEPIVVVEGKKVTSDDQALVNREIDFAIKKIANGDVLDLDEKAIGEVLKLVSDKASAVGLIDSSERIDDLFSRQSLKDRIKDKTVEYNQAVVRADTRMDASREADKIEKVEAITRYTESRKEDTDLSRVSRDADKAAREVGSDQSVKKRKTKMDQIIASGLEEYERQQEGDVLSDILRATEKLTSDGGDFTMSDGSVVALTSEEAKATREAMTILVEMRNANRKAKNNSSKHSISAVTEQLYRQRMQGQFNGQNPERQEAVDARIAEIIAEQRKSESAEQRRTEISGPVFDIKDAMLSDVVSAAMENERIAKRNKKNPNKKNS